MEIFDLSIKTKATKGANEGVNEGVKRVHFKAESEGVNEELNESCRFHQGGSGQVHCR